MQLSSPTSWEASWIGFIGGGSSRHSRASSASSVWCCAELATVADVPGSDGGSAVGAGDSGSSLCLSWREKFRVWLVTTLSVTRWPLPLTSCQILFWSQLCPLVVCQFYCVIAYVIAVVATFSWKNRRENCWNYFEKFNMHSRSKFLQSKFAHMGTFGLKNTSMSFKSSLSVLYLDTFNHQNGVACDPNQTSYQIFRKTWIPKKKIYQKRFFNSNAKLDGFNRSPIDKTLLRRSETYY